MISRWGVVFMGDPMGRAYLASHVRALIELREMHHHLMRSTMLHFAIQRSRGI